MSCLVSRWRSTGGRLASSCPSPVLGSVCRSLAVDDVSMGGLHGFVRIRVCVGCL